MSLPWNFVSACVPESNFGIPYMSVEVEKALNNLNTKKVKSSLVINVFRRQGCPHLGQGHRPIVSSRHKTKQKKQLAWMIYLLVF